MTVVLNSVSTVFIARALTDILAATLFETLRRLAATVPFGHELLVVPYLVHACMHVRLHVTTSSLTDPQMARTLHNTKH